MAQYLVELGSPSSSIKKFRRQLNNTIIELLISLGWMGTGLQYHYSS